MKACLIFATIALGATQDSPKKETIAFDAPKFGLKVALPSAWKLALRERDEKILVALIDQEDPTRPGVAACELGVAPENLDEYRTRIDGNAKRGGRPGTLVRNHTVETPKGKRLESLWEFRPGESLWLELSVRIIKNRQMYTFILNVDEATWKSAKPAFDAMVDSAVFAPPNTGSDLSEAKSNRWQQREFKFAVDLPTGWSPVLAPAEIALLFASGPARGVWSDNFLVIAQPRSGQDLAALRESLPRDLRAAEPNCEVVSCELTKQGQAQALETVVRTQRGPFSMTVIERRFTGERFDYEIKATVETKRFEELSPALRRCFDSFAETPGDVPDPKLKSRDG